MPTVAQHAGVFGVPAVVCGAVHAVRQPRLAAAAGHVVHEDGAAALAEERLRSSAPEHSQWVAVRGGGRNDTQVAPWPGKRMGGLASNRGVPSLQAAWSSTCQPMRGGAPGSKFRKVVRCRENCGLSTHSYALVTRTPRPAHLRLGHAAVVPQLPAHHARVRVVPRAAGRRGVGAQSLKGVWTMPCVGLVLLNALTEIMHHAQHDDEDWGVPSTPATLPRYLQLTDRTTQ